VDLSTPGFRLKLSIGVIRSWSQHHWLHCWIFVLRGVFSPSARALSLDLVVPGHQSPAGVNPSFDFCFACRCTSQSRLPAQLRSRWLGLFFIFLLRQVQPKPAVLVLFLLIEILAGSAPVNSFSANAVSCIISHWLGSLLSIVVPDLVRILVVGDRYSLNHRIKRLEFSSFL
jgi:hypothetical protein